MTVRTRLLLTLGGIIVLMLIPAAYAVRQLNRLEAIAVDLEAEHAGDVLALGRLRTALAEYDRFQRSYIISPNLEVRAATSRELRLARGRLAQLVSSGYGDAAERTALLLDSLEVASTRLERLVEAQRGAEATQYFEAVKPVLDSARLSLDRIAAEMDRRGRAAVGHAERVSQAAANTTTFAAFIALALTLVLGLWTTHALSRPLQRLRAATSAVADGEFGAPENLPYRRPDEIGDLSRSFAVMTERLRELDRLKAEFVSLASHELKTPINVITGYVELLDEGLYGDLTAKQREVLDLVQDQARALTRLVNQLLDLSRFEAGGFQLEIEEVDPSELLERVEQSFRGLARQKQIDFAVDREPGLPPTIRADPDRLQHEVLSNLLSNAFKFTPTGGRIALRARAADGHVFLEVSDSGVGIPPEELPHIFEKYYQVGKEARLKGSGLGLAIARSVVEAHGGEIDVESAIGQGTRFEIRLPAEAAPPDGQAAPAPEPPHPVESDSDRPES